MTNEAPTLSDYEETAAVTFDLDSEELDREAINAELERLFTR
jgi:hypothetical protein